MSSGAAVLATKAGAWEEIIEPGLHGWLVAPDDQKAITEKLEALINCPERTRKMGAEGRAHVLKNYSVEDEARRLCNIYESYMGDPQLCPEKRSELVFSK